MLAERKTVEFSGQAVLDAIPDPVCLVEPESFRLLAVNHRFAELFGPAAEILGNPCYQITHGQTEPCSNVEHPCVVSEAIRLGKPSRGEHVHRSSDGEEQIFEATAAHLDPTAVGSPLLYCLRDITQLRRGGEEIRRLSQIDSLTGLPNRVLFMERFAGLIDSARRENGLIGVLIIDLDRFKGINDTLGHEVGDLLLQGVSRRLRDCLRKGDTMARIGGDEFLVLLPGLTAEPEAEEIANRILQQTAAPFDLDGQEIFTSVSIGLAFFPEDGLDADALLKSAEFAMYQAKQQGRNNIQRFALESNAGAVERLVMETGLRHALERDELFLHFQPQVEASTGEVIGCEALLRWQHPYLGVIPPVKFIPVAEESGLILAIGESVLWAACRQAVALQQQGLPPLRMAVNISGRQFQDPHLAELVAKVLEETGLPPEQLELELTESMLMEGGEATLAALRRFKKMGLQLAIDDFGTGYSSLSYLKNFPIDRVKIDRAFVKDIGTEQDDGTLAAAIVALAHSLKLEVIAEGVEEVCQFRFLAELGCDEIQGYLFSKPLSASDLVKYLTEPQPLPGTTS